MRQIFEILFFNWQPWQNFEEEKAFLRVNLIGYISGTEGRKKLKFGEASLQICPSFSREN